MTAPKRRWPSFSLRTLFVVVTMVCCWLAWNVHQIDERDFVLEAIEARGGSIRHVEFFRGPGVSPKQMPLLWSLVGARPIESLALPASLYTDSDLEYAKSMFPEADVNLIPLQKLYRRGSFPTFPMPTSTLKEDVDYTRRNLKTPEGPLDHRRKDLD